MTLVPWDDTVPENYLATARPATEEEQSIWGAAFRQENPVVNAYAAITRPAFTPNPDFDLAARLRQAPEALVEPNLFAAIESDEEFDYVLNRVRQQTQDRQTLEAAGVAGIGAAMVSGMLSPTILLPGGAIYKNIRGGVALGRTAASGAGWNMVGGAIDEGFIYVTQETRRPEDFVLGVASAAILGGLFGGSAGLLTRRQIERFEADMANPGENAVIQPFTAEPVGAQVAEPESLIDPGGTLRVGLDRASTFLSPVTRNLNQGFSPTLRAFQARLNTGGLYLTGNLEGIAVRGGEIGALRNQHYTLLYNVKQREADIWNAYIEATPVGQRMNLQDYYRSVGQALERGGVHENEHVQRLAQAYREELFIPMLQEARRVGMRGFDNITDEEAMSYIPRVLRQGIAQRDRMDLEQILTEHFEEVMFARFKRQYERLEGLTTRDEQTLSDIGLDADEAQALREELETEISTLPQQFPEAREIAEQIRAMRAEARGQRTAEARALREAAKALEKEHKDILKNFKAAERALKKRFSNLTNTRSGFEARQQKALNQIDRIEEQQLSTLQRTAKRAHALLSKYERGEIIQADKLNRLREQFERAYLTFERGATRLDKLQEMPEGFEHLVHSDLRSSEAVSKLEDRQAQRQAALDQLIERLNDLEAGRPQDELYQAIKENYDNLITATNTLNSRRALRIAKLEERAKALDPKRTAEMQTELRQKIDNRRLDFMERLQINQRANVLVKTDAAGRMNLGDKKLKDAVSFREAAQELAFDTYGRMTGENGRLPGLTLMQERGPELARTLNIDPTRVWSNGRTYEEFLERDIEKLSRRYIRTMATDIELQRAFGTVQPLGKDSPILAKINKEFHESLEAVSRDTKLTETQRNKKIDRLNKQWSQALQDLNVQIDRLRYVRGIPDDPEAIPFRAGRFALNVNLLRLMGGVVISSLPDMGSVIARHGLLNAFRDGFVPMIRDFKSFKMSVDEARHAGVNLDVALHSRMAALYDIMDEVEHGTMPERAVQTMANKFGLYSGMDHYNTGMKSFAGALINGRMMRALENVAEGSRAKRDIAYLAANGIDAIDAGRMWQEITQTPGGGNRVNGAWLPNTMDWGDQELARMYRAALGRQVESEIVTPGTERPNWSDQNMIARLIFQFRSFTFASHFRLVTASMQEARIGNIVPVTSGVITSLAMGAVSYYLWANVRGSETRNEMLNAGPERWANEAVNRSGVLGVLAEVKNFGEELPYTRGLATLGAETSSRASFGNPIGRMAGPTVGLASDVQTIATTINDPTQRTTNAIRRLFPYQNHSALAWAFDMIQEMGNEELGID